MLFIWGRGTIPLPHIANQGEDDLVIAVDGGFDYLEKIGLRADYVLGDSDFLFQHPVICHPTASATQKKKTIRT